MSIEQSRSWTGSSPHVTQRLCATIVFFIGVICVCGGYMLGRMSRSELKRSHDVISFNLTIAAETLYKRAKRISPKAIHHNDPGKITQKLLDIFRCTASECGGISNVNLAGFVKNCLINEVNKFMRSIQNATVYLDSLR